MSEPGHKWQRRRQAFRRHIENEVCLFPASVFDPLSARIAEDIGFEAGMFAGSQAALAILGAPDYVLITLTEFAEQAHRISRASELPLMVDADHGYGNPLSVARTVEELEAAGVAGLSIEDTVLPEPHSSSGQPRIAALEEGLARVKAAVSARRDPDLVIAGRTSAASLTDLDDAIARVQAYEAAGADLLFLIGLKSRVDLERVASATSAPLMLGGVPVEMRDAEYLASQRVRLCLYGHQTMPASVAAIEATMRAIRLGTPVAELAGLADKPTMDRLTRRAEYDAMRKQFL
ncbi:MAG: isocitrate lyase/PEP mutase family protein [Pseudomonadota bacterium]